MIKEHEWISPIMMDNLEFDIYSKQVDKLWKHKSMVDVVPRI
jgi:hypothetical protein